MEIIYFGECLLKFKIIVLISFGNPFTFFFFNIPVVSKSIYVYKYQVFPAAPLSLSRAYLTHTKLSSNSIPYNLSVPHF